MASLAPSQSDPEIRSSFRKRESKKQTQKQQNKTVCISQYCQPGELVKKLSLCRCRKTHPPYSFSTNEEDWRLVLPSLIHRAKSILARWWCSVWWSHSAKGFRHEDGPREWNRCLYKRAQWEPWSSHQMRAQSHTCLWTSKYYLSRHRLPDPNWQDGVN